MGSELKKICFYVPESAAEKVKAAMFQAGAGRFGNYDQLCWQTIGTGQFRPLPGAKPQIGSVGKLEHVSEVKIEMSCSNFCLQEALDALVSAHPYEEPAFEVYSIEQSGAK